jgi:ketosteroid isomerase-like protein
MSQENVEAARRCFEFWTNRDFSAFREVAHLDLVWDVSRRVFNPAVYHGLDGFRRFVEQVDEMWENLQFVPEEFIDAGDHVFTSIRLSGWGRGSGVQAGMREFATWTFREVKLSRVTGGFRDRAEALEAAGLRK